MAPGLIVLTVFCSFPRRRIVIRGEGHLLASAAMQAITLSHLFGGEYRPHPFPHPRIGSFDSFRSALKLSVHGPGMGFRVAWAGREGK